MIHSKLANKFVINHNSDFENNLILLGATAEDKLQIGVSQNKIENTCFTYEDLLIELGLQIKALVSFFCKVPECIDKLAQVGIKI